MGALGAGEMEIKLGSWRRVLPAACALLRADTHNWRARVGASRLLVQSAAHRSIDLLAGERPPEPTYRPPNSSPSERSARSPGPSLGADRVSARDGLARLVSSSRALVLFARAAALD